MTVICIILSLIIVIADRITKHIAETVIAAKRVVEVIPNTFSFIYTENTGAAFSLFSDKTWLLGLISIAFCIFVVVYWIVKKPCDKVLCISVALLFSGALGNAIDRVFYGYVIDFIRTDFINFPVFNVADIAITIGAVLLVIYTIFFDKESS